MVENEVMDQRHHAGTSGIQIITIPSSIECAGHNVSKLLVCAPDDLENPKDCDQPLIIRRKLLPHRLQGLWWI